MNFLILDLSKIVMYDFRYSYVMKKFNDNVKLLYTDTDLFSCQFSELDIYEIMKRDNHKFHTSDYDANNSYNIPKVTIFVTEIANIVELKSINIIRYNSRVDVVN